MSVIDWACVGRPLPGQTSSGDRGLVIELERGAVAAVIDGLGHGPEADAASGIAAEVIARMAGQPIAEIVRACHEACRQTRGVVLSLARFDDQGSMSWLGVGNVEAVLVRAGLDNAEAIPARGGTVGYMLPPLNPRTLDVAVGDTLVFASDGIKHGFKQEILAARSPKEIADQVVARWAKDTDDACAVVARYVGADASATVGASWPA